MARGVLALETADHVALRIWGISQLEYYKLFDEVFDAIRQGTSSDQVQNVEVLLKLGKAGGVLAPTTLPRVSHSFSIFHLADKTVS